MVFVRVCFSLVYTFKIEWLHARPKRSRDIVYIVSACRTEINVLFKICIDAKTEDDTPDYVIHSLLLLVMTCAKFERNPRLSHMAIKPVHNTTAFNNNSLGVEWLSKRKGVIIGSIETTDNRNIFLKIKLYVWDCRPSCTEPNLTFWKSDSSQNASKVYSSETNADPDIVFPLVSQCHRYFRNFRDNFIFAKNVKRHICEVKNREWSMIYIHKRQSDFAISRGFYFHETSQNKTLAIIFDFTVAKWA